MHIRTHVGRDGMAQGEKMAAKIAELTEQLRVAEAEAVAELSRSAETEAVSEKLHKTHVHSLDVCLPRPCMHHRWIDPGETLKRKTAAALAVCLLIHTSIDRLINRSMDRWIDGSFKHACMRLHIHR